MAARRRASTSTSNRRPGGTSQRAAAPTASTRTPAQARPVAEPGKHVHVLDVPFADRGVAAASGARWDKETRQTIYIGATLPMGLQPYAAPDYSWQRWVEDDLNTTPRPPAPPAYRLRPRPHQVTAAHAIDRAARDGWRGYVMADDVGLGKTAATWCGALLLARHRPVRTVLIVCPKGVVAHWRETIAAVGNPDGLRICVINYDRVKHLLTVPDSAAHAKTTRTKNKRIVTSGQPLVAWDLVILDESHKVKNADSQRTKAVARIARYAAAAKDAPFVVWMSATIGQNPIEVGYLAPLLAQITGAKRTDLADYGQWLADQGFHVTYNARFDKWEWCALPADASPAQVAHAERWKDADVRRINALLFGPGAPSIRRLPTDIAGWPEIQRILAPVDLNAAQRVLYGQAWTTFRAEMRLARSGRDPKGARAARLRFRQKASLLRVPGTVEQVLDLLDNGHQVAVSCQWLETVDALAEALAAQGVTCAQWTGRNDGVREAERVTFQRGLRSVMLFNVTEGISLQQGQVLSDGSRASAAPRTTIVHDPRYSGIDSIQVEGRCHRDGQHANVYYPYAEGTVEGGIVALLLSRIITTKAMMGDDVSAVRRLEATLSRDLDALLDAGADADVDAGLPADLTPEPSTGVTNGGAGQEWRNELSGRAENRTPMSARPRTEPGALRRALQERS